MWADAFHNYTTTLASFFGMEVPDLHFVFAEFHTNIYELFTVHEWQEAVLPMAIEARIFIVAQQTTDLSKWVLLEKLQGMFYKARTMIGMGLIMRAGGKRKRSRSHSGGRRGKLSGSNNPSITCELFNQSGCDRPPYIRAHKCKACGSRDHGLSECKAKGKKRS